MQRGTRIGEAGGSFNSIQGAQKHFKNIFMNDGEEGRRVQIFILLNPPIKWFMPCFSGKYFQTFWHIFCRYILFGCQESLTNFIVCLTDLSRGMENVRMRCDLSHQNWGGRECLGRVRAAGQSGMRLNLVFNSYFIDRGSLYRRGPGSCDDSLRRICWIAAIDVFQKLKCQLIFKQQIFVGLFGCWRGMWNDLNMMTANC